MVKSSLKKKLSIIHFDILRIIFCLTLKVSLSKDTMMAGYKPYFGKDSARESCLIWRECAGNTGTILFTFRNYSRLEMRKILEIIKSMIVTWFLPQFKNLTKKKKENIEIVLFSEFSPLCLSWQICSIWSRYSAFFTLVLAVPLERPLAFPIKFCQMAVAFWRTLRFILFHYIFKVSTIVKIPSSDI